MSYLLSQRRDAMSLAFAALADPTRRRIVELLVETGPLRVSDVTRRLPVTRQAVAKHLDSLAEAGVTTTKRQGRERITALADNAFASVEEWLRHYDRFWEERLDVLKRQVEKGERT